MFEAEVILAETFSEHLGQPLVIGQQVAHHLLHDLSFKFAELDSLIVLALALLSELTSAGAPVDPITKVVAISTRAVMALLPFIERIRRLLHAI